MLCFLQDSGSRDAKGRLTHRWSFSELLALQRGSFWVGDLLSFSLSRTNNSHLISPFLSGFEKKMFSVLGHTVYSINSKNFSVTKS